MQQARDKIKQYSSHVIVGITGHRDLLQEDQQKVMSLIKGKLAGIRNNHTGKKLLLVSALAPGADQWAADCREGGDGLLIVRLFNEEAAKRFQYNEGQEPEKGKDLVFQEAYNHFLALCSQHTAAVVMLGENNAIQPANDEEAKRQFIELGKFLARHCDYLIALWDGVDGAGEGGTSDVVRMFLKGKSNDGRPVEQSNKKQVLYHLPVPRLKNHFPVGRRFDLADKELPVSDSYQWVTSVAVHSKKHWTGRIVEGVKKHSWFLSSAILLFVFFYVLDRGQLPADESMNIIPALSLLLIYIGCWIWYKVRKASRSLFRQFVFPLVIILFTITSGTYGFYQTEKYSLSDSFFAAANLLTLNSSIFSSMLEGKENNINLWLVNARITGAFFLTYAFVLALALTAGKEIFNQLGFWFRRLFNTKFAVVIGDGEMAADLANDLEQEGLRVAFLYTGSDEAYEDNFIDKKIWFLKGQSTMRKSLLKTCYWKSEEVYIFNNADELNFRTIQEMDNISISEKKPGRQQWYVHLASLRERALAQKISRKQITAFSIHENAARRLLHQYPIDRFNKHQHRYRNATISKVIIIGFNELGKQIALTSLRLGHYIDNKYNEVKVYYLPDEKNEVDLFVAQHPELNKNVGPFGATGEFTAAQYYTFFQHTDCVIEFCELPTAESVLIDPHFSLYEHIRPEFATSIYVCLSTGLASASLLGNILPVLQWLKLDKNNMHGNKQCDIQVFCYYNFPDKNEEEYIEIELNTIAPHIPVYCFGNMLQECSAAAIRNKSLDMLARQIALRYENQRKGIDSIDNCWDEVELEANWSSLKEIERESNRQAADHAWVKFREIGLDFQAPQEEVTVIANEVLKDLAELEHRRWNAEKLLMGWLPYSNTALWVKEKNAIRDQKYHLHLTTFAMLPREEQEKDHDQVNGIRLFLRKLYKK